MGKSGFLTHLGAAMLFDITLFVVAMSLFIFFALPSLGFAYILAIGVLSVAGFGYYFYRRRVATKSRT